MTSTTENAPTRVAPPNKHQLAFMIWLCVFPTLTAINVVFGDWLRPMSPVLRTFVLAYACARFEAERPMLGGADVQGHWCLPPNGSSYCTDRREM